jgi:hypothetical protein
VGTDSSTGSWCWALRDCHRAPGRRSQVERLILCVWSSAVDCWVCRGSVAALGRNWVSLGPCVVVRLTSSTGAWDADRGARVPDGVSLVSSGMRRVLVGTRLGSIQRDRPACKCRDVPMEGISRPGTRVRAIVAENCQTLGESMPGVCYWVPAEPIDPLPSPPSGHVGRPRRFPSLPEPRAGELARIIAALAPRYPAPMLRSTLLRCTAWIRVLAAVSNRRSPLARGMSRAQRPAHGSGDLTTSDRCRGLVRNHLSRPGPGHCPAIC